MCGFSFLRLYIHLMQVLDKTKRRRILFEFLHFSSRHTQSDPILLIKFALTFRWWLNRNNFRSLKSFLSYFFLQTWFSIVKLLYHSVRQVFLKNIKNSEKSSVPKVFIDLLKEFQKQWQNRNGQNLSTWRGWT